jgi:hypothetical protein
MSQLAEIFRRHGPAYRAGFAARMPHDQLRAMRAIEACRTPALGGHVWRCPQCGKERWSFHSCGNRHCPTCGQDDAQEWLRRQEALRLPVTYHLCTFTVPEELRGVIRSHPREGLAILFAASSSTLLDLCANPKWLGAQPGATGVLHTWTRAQVYHPHIHYLITGGGLAPEDSWREADPEFLVPVTALSPVFRARFRDALRKRLPDMFALIPKKVWRRDWVVHSKPVGNGGAGLALSEPLHLPRGLSRFGDSRPRRIPRHLPLSRFGNWQIPKDDPPGHGIHPPLPPACVALGLCENTPLRLAPSLPS